MKLHYSLLTTDLILLSTEWLLECHRKSLDNSGQQNILRNFLMSEKYLNTRMGTEVEPSMYLDFLHLGQLSNLEFSL